MISTGDLMTFRCLHADGQWYKRWQANIESISDTEIVTYAAPNGWVEVANRGVAYLPRAMRGYYWHNKFFNLIEVINADGSLDEIYINVAGPLISAGDELHFIDHELDVIKLPSQPARIIDQDEFEEAIKLYGYSVEFQAKCWQAAEEARQLAEAWLTRK